jgi:hypothetical protein
LIATVALASCTSEKPPAATNHWLSLGQARAGEVTVELGTDGRLETGLSPIHIKLTASSGAPVTDVPVSFEPVMSMASGKRHGCPTIGAPELGADGSYHTAAVFQMASSEMDIWSATVRVNDSDADSAAAIFEQLDVSDSGRAQVFSYAEPGSSETRKFVASLNFAAPVRIGLNPLVFTLHQMTDMMTFVPVEDAAIVLDPQMPSMGHGSPGSVNPTPTSLGRYAGQLSFSMAGTWETTVTISRAGVVIGAPKFATML